MQKMRPFFSFNQLWQASSNMFSDPTPLLAKYGVRYKIVSSIPKRILVTQAFERKGFSSEEKNV